MIKTDLIKAAKAAGGMVIGALLALSLSSLFQYPHRFLLGIMAVLLTLSGLQSRRGAGWHLLDFIRVLLIAEVMIFLTVVLSLAPIANRFAEISLFVALPWMLGYGVGSVCLVSVVRQRPIFARSWVLAAVYTVSGVLALVLVPHLRQVYSEFATPMPRVTLYLLRISPEVWFFSALGFSGFAIWKDLVLRQGWPNLVFPIPLLLLTLGLFVPLL